MRVHFLGIGGIGVSALAQYYLAKGYIVSGSDLISSEMTDLLKKKGARIHIGKNKIPENADLVIYSPAVKIINYKLKIPTLSYPQALGELTKKHFTIAVSGTHGKTTTTAMIALILIKAGLNPTVIIGTKLKEFRNSNFRMGGKVKVMRTLLRGRNVLNGRNVLIIEADEHLGSFLNYWPKIIVITNIEADHLDYYKNLKNIKRSFAKFIGHLPKDGILITSKSVDKKAAPEIKRIIKVPGDHNVYDASLALATAKTLKISDKISLKTLGEYKGAWRRFEILQLKPFILISDYGHNPKKAMAALEAAREKYPRKKIWCVYQPHQYSRTHYLFRDFVKTFKSAMIDKIIITDIYDVAGREEKKIKKEVNSQKLVRAVNKENVVYLPQKKVLTFLKKNLDKINVLIIMGAGDIYKLVDKIKK